MSITEKYVRATQSSNLKDDAWNHTTDSLISIALSKVKMASCMYRVRYANDATSYKELLGYLTIMVDQKAKHREWPQHVSVSKVTNAALEYWINPVCPCCKGRGHALHFNKHGGKEFDCETCNSTGLKKIEGDARIRQYVTDTVGLLHEVEVEVIRTMKR